MKRLAKNRHVTASSRCEQVEWRDDPDALRRWQEGTTGLPLVDANMREMAQTGAWSPAITLMTALVVADRLLPQASEVHVSLQK